jgi:hypothetical protein
LFVGVQARDPLLLVTWGQLQEHRAESRRHASGVVALDIYEPDAPRARELLAAIGATLGVEKIAPARGQTHYRIGLNMAWERAHEFAEQALDEEGDEDRHRARPHSAVAHSRAAAAPDVPREPRRTLVYSGGARSWLRCAVDRLAAS